MPCTKAWLHQQLEINGNCYTELIPRELSVIYEEQTSRSILCQCFSTKFLKGSAK